MLLIKAKFEVSKFLGIDYSSNVYALTYRDEVVLIDAGIDSQVANQVIRELTQLKPSVKVKALILTHAHIDHAGGAAAIVEKFSPKVYAHILEAESIQSGDEARILSFMFPFEFKPVEVTDLVKNGDKIEICDDCELTVIHTPGHTAGSICLYDQKNKLLFTGDTVFADGAVGRVDLPTGNSEQLIESLRKLSTLDVIAFFPGHGEPIMYAAKEQITDAYKYANMYL